MGQRICTLLLISLAMIHWSCDKSDGSLPATRPTAIVSLTPAGTDLLVQMGLKDRIVGISPYDADPDLKARLPKVGDYQRVDWEKLSELKPGYLIVQGRADRQPPGLKQRCDEMGIEVVNIQIDRISDITVAANQLGAALGATNEAQSMIRRLTDTLNQIRSTAASNVPALIVLTENGKSVVGRENYLNDLLVLAGGENVVDLRGYVTIDQERLLTYRPQVIFVLMPSATQISVAEAVKSLQSAADLPAVRNDRIVPITFPDALLPGTGIARLAETFADHLRSATTQPGQP